MKEINNYLYGSLSNTPRSSLCPSPLLKMIPPTPLHQTYLRLHSRFILTKRILFSSVKIPCLLHRRLDSPPWPAAMNTPAITQYNDWWIRRLTLHAPHSLNSCPPPPQVRNYAQNVLVNSDRFLCTIERNVMSL